MTYVSRLVHSLQAQNINLNSELISFRDDLYNLKRTNMTRRMPSPLAIVETPERTMPPPSLPQSFPRRLMIGVLKAYQTAIIRHNTLNSILVVSVHCENTFWWTQKLFRVIFNCQLKSLNDKNHETCDLVETVKIESIMEVLGGDQTQATVGTQTITERRK